MTSIVFSGMGVYFPSEVNVVNPVSHFRFVHMIKRTMENSPCRKRKTGKTGIFGRNYRVHHQLSDIRFVFFDLVVPPSACLILAELTRQLGSVAEHSAILSTKASLRANDAPCM